MTTVSLKPLYAGHSKTLFEIMKKSKFEFVHLSDDLEHYKKILEEKERKRSIDSLHPYVIQVDDLVVGAIQAEDHRFSHVCELAYFIGKEYQGCGIGTIALTMMEDLCFNDYAYERLELFINPENKPSVHIAKKRGFEFEGILKKAEFVHGKYGHLAAYAKLHEFIK
jgi:diamine N-acetyltransferase